MGRIKKILQKKKPQLRRCAFCDKPGHNKSTCSDFLSSANSTQIPTAPIKPIKFFVHHVAHAPQASSHVVNLRKEKNVAWHEVKIVQPESNKDLKFEADYLQIKKQEDKKTVLAEEINPKIFAKLPNHVEKDSIFKTEVHYSDKETDKDFILPPIKKAAKKIDLVTPVIRQIDLASLAIKSQTKKLYNHILNFLKENFVLRRLVSVTIILMIILIAPGQASSYFQDVKLTKNQIAQDSTAGFLSLQNSTAALMQANIPQAQTAIDDALKSFGTAVETMESKHQILQKIASTVPVLQSEVKSRQDLLLAGQKIAQGNTYLLKGISLTQSQVSSTLAVRLDTMISYLNSAIPNYKEALEKLGAVDPDSLPLDYQGPFKEFKIIFTSVLSDLQHLSDLGGSIKEIFGAQGQRRYLLVFQNPSELRPTGGFLGSIAIMDIKDGKILDLEVPPGGTYDLQGQLDQYLEPPTPLLLTNKRWELQDANWFPDWSASAQKIMWFYRHSRNVTVDGVIAINASVLERLLSITGPITDSKRDLTITADNALPIIQQVVEEGPEKKDNKPKQILSDLAPQFIDHFKNSQPKDLLPLLINLQDALTKKEIQAYFSDRSAQEAVEQMGWSGEILKTNSEQDYLSVFNANIHGQKSDAKIKQTISHQAIVQPDGTITDTVVITRTHTGNSNEKLYGAANIDYIRIYVPQNSELLSASGFTWPDESAFKVPEDWYKTDDFLTNTEKEIKIDERTGTNITNEFGKTAFGNWIITEPGQTSQIQFTYKLPFKLTNQDKKESSWQKIISNKLVEHYQLVVQKQSGIDSNFESQIIFPENWSPSYQEGDGLQIAKNGASIGSLILNTDRVWGIVMEK